MSVKAVSVTTEFFPRVGLRSATDRRVAGVTSLVGRILTATVRIPLLFSEAFAGEIVFVYLDSALFICVSSILGHRFGVRPGDGGWKYWRWSGRNKFSEAMIFLVRRSSGRGGDATEKRTCEALLIVFSPYLCQLQI